MSKHKPRVSIGLAVYNGEDYLQEAIDSILAQTYKDFELIICDNASTDRTSEICQVYATQDDRVRYHRNPTNIGGANNENLTAKMARGEYFRWAAHDDVCEPTIIEKCVSVLDTDPEVVLCYTATVYIDADGNIMWLNDQELGSSDKPHERFLELSRWDHGCESTYGLIRTDILRRTGLQRSYTDSDRTLLCHLGLMGRFHMIREPLFYKRIHPNMSTELFKDWRERMEWFDAANRTRITLPHWSQFLHYLEIIRDSSLPAGERMHCFLHMWQWLVEYGRWRSMGKDIIIASQKMYSQMRIRPKLVPQGKKET